MSFDPRTLEFGHWSALTAPLLLPYGFVQNVEPEDRWRDWASAATNLPSLANLQVPDNRAYEDWRDWAFIFNEKIGFLGL